MQMVTRGRWLSTLSNLYGFTVANNDRLLFRVIPIRVQQQNDSTQKTPTESNGRKRRIREQVLIKREIIKQVMEKNAQEIQLEVQRRRKLIQQMLKTRKENLRDTERKLREQSRLIIEDIRETKNIVKERVEDVIERENIYTIPNLLCVTRIAFSPYLAYLILSESYQYALIFMVVASVSDWLDGWIARNFKSQSSKIGSFLDPMADKVLIGTLFLSLTYVGLIPTPLTVMIVARDVALVLAGFIIRYKSLPPPRTLARYFDATHATAQLAPTLVSKLNTGVQMLLIGSTLAAPVLGYVGHPALDVLCYVTATTTVLSALSYLTSKSTYRYLQRQE